MTYVPARLTAPLAAALANRSARDIRRQIRAGLIDAEGGAGWLRVPTSAVEQLRGAPISGGDYLAALARLEPRRQRENERNRRRRGG